MQLTKMFKVQPGGCLRGSLQVPGDKSISHRAVMLSAIAQGTSHIQGFLAAEDCLATLTAFEQMGVNIERLATTNIAIQGVGLKGLRQPSGILNMGNSGTSIRLLAGLLAGQTFNTELTGDASLLKRPMARVVDPLRLMGAHIEMQEQGTAPLFIYGNPLLQGIHYELPVPSAQVKSALLLAGLYAEGETILMESTVTRDHTERMLQTFGYPIELEDQQISIRGHNPLTAAEIQVPADISSAAFFMAGATIAPGSEIILRNVGINSTRIGVLNILRIMGADIRFLEENWFGSEPVADIKIRHAPLQGIEIPIEQVPLAIDEFPILFIAAACAEGTTVLRGAKELRVKESDRIAAMAEGLTTLGIQVETLPDGIIIEGGQLNGGQINSYGDHRIAMAFAMAGLVARKTIEITDCANVATSFPNFIELAQQAGLNIT